MDEAVAFAVFAVLSGSVFVVALEVWYRRRTGRNMRSPRYWHDHPLTLTPSELNHELMGTPAPNRVVRVERFVQRWLLPTVLITIVASTVVQLLTD